MDNGSRNTAVRMTASEPTQQALHLPRRAKAIMATPGQAPAQAVSFGNGPSGFGLWQHGPRKTPRPGLKS